MSRLTIDQHILLLTLGASAPGVVVALALLWTGDYTPKVQWTLSAIAALNHTLQYFTDFLACPFLATC